MWSSRRPRRSWNPSSFHPTLFPTVSSSCWCWKAPVKVWMSKWPQDFSSLKIAGNNSPTWSWAKSRRFGCIGTPEKASGANLTCADENWARQCCDRSRQQLWVPQGRQPEQCSGLAGRAGEEEHLAQEDPVEEQGAAAWQHSRPLCSSGFDVLIPYLLNMVSNKMNADVFALAPKDLQSRWLPSGALFKS